MAKETKKDLDLVLDVHLLFKESAIVKNVCRFEFCSRVDSIFHGFDSLFGVVVSM